MMAVSHLNLYPSSLELLSVKGKSIINIKTGEGTLLNLEKPLKYGLNVNTHTHTIHHSSVAAASVEVR